MAWPASETGMINTNKYLCLVLDIQQLMSSVQLTEVRSSDHLHGTAGDVVVRYDCTKWEHVEAKEQWTEDRTLRNP